jgi:hypothetical protein
VQQKVYSKKNTVFNKNSMHNNTGNSNIVDFEKMFVIFLLPNFAQKATDLDDECSTCISN